MPQAPDRSVEKTDGDGVGAYLDALVDAAREILGRDLVGVYAAGSLALDAFQPGRSDIDIALVCRTDLSAGAKEALVARLRHDALPCPARGLELVVYTLAAARSGAPEAGFELELNDGPAMAFRSTLRPEDRPVADGLFWYGLDRSILATRGRALLGPPAAEVFTDLGPVELTNLLIDSLRWWMALPTPPGDEPAVGADDAVLGACRALVRHRFGVWLSKVDAGRRLLTDRDRDADVIEQSIAARDGGPAPTGRRARAFQEQVLDEISS
jgi:hypothetical protein